MKIYKYLILIRNLLIYLKENLSDECWEEVKKVLKEKNYSFFCEKCGNICDKVAENQFLCKNCNILYIHKEDILDDND